MILYYKDFFYYYSLFSTINNYGLLITEPQEYVTINNVSLKCTASDDEESSSNWF